MYVLRLVTGLATEINAEGVGLEPTWGVHPMGDFKSPAIDHSATPPKGVRPRRNAGPFAYS